MASPLFDLHITKPVEIYVFRSLAELLQPSSDIASTSRSIATQGQAAVTNLMFQQLEMANLYLDISVPGSGQHGIERGLAKAKAARNRLTDWLNRGMCAEDNVPDMLDGVATLTERLDLCKPQKASLARPKGPG